MKSAFFTALLALAGAHAKSTSHVQNVVVENLHRVPQGWNEVGVPAQDRKLHFRIGMRSPDHALFDQTLMDISTPSHPRYGQHLKRHELKQLIKPKEESTTAVLTWLEHSGIPAADILDDGEWINFVATVATAEELLDTTFKSYQNTNRPDVKKIRTLHYSVPDTVRDHIDLIQPTTRFAQLRPQSNNIHDQEEVPFTTAALVNATCASSVTPQCLKDLYNFADYTPGNASVTIGVTGYLEQYARFNDWSQFASTYAPNVAGTNFTWTSVNGGLLDQSSTNSSVEANLDLQYTLGLAAPAAGVNFYSTAGRGVLVPDLDQPTEDDNQNEPYLDLFLYLHGLPDDKLPQVLSTSYGEDEQSVPPEYNKKVCNLIGQLGARGVSVIFSSGDTGVGSACQTNDGKNTTRFLPIFPAACPYVTSVGGTTGVNPEKAVSFSSGGFSDLYPTPEYQTNAVSAYLKKLGSQWDGLYNAKGRGFPDVAALGTSYRVVDKGALISVGGTSASAPTFASIISLLNNARLSSGKPALGFLNPWLYQSASGFNDITLGGSTGCTGRSIYSGLKAPYVPNASWNATEGWDPVTGLGTPDFGKLLKLTQGGGYGTGRRGLDGRV